MMDSIETAKIVAIDRCVLEQMSLSKPDKDSEDHIKNVGEFHYELSVGGIFTTWYARNRDFYENRMAELPNETSIHMLLRKFSKSDQYLYLAYVLPLSPEDLAFEETIEKCEKGLGDNTSLFSRRFKCLNLAVREGKDIHKYTAVVNRMNNTFSYWSLRKDQFSCFVLIQRNLPEIVVSFR
ncbi:unnamed protein product [Hymenolepis diminuta]|uniref:DUF7083 domain-containing protein n=1 Tax=Hymenolepis diminuta TaxID=6216 RepID=A0A0R3SG90_HYMDI|nr:unnamed protein product [Hymenolepis diminuta]